MSTDACSVLKVNIYIYRRFGTSGKPASLRKLLHHGSEGSKLMVRLRTLVSGMPSLRWYEVTVVALAMAVFVAAGLAWRLDPERGLNRAVEIAEPTFVALGTLSVFLLWVQMRQANTWNRVTTYHQFFPEFPATAKREAVRKGFGRVLGYSHPPTFYRPISGADARKVNEDPGTPDEPPLGTHLRWYLNEFELFCGAINCGMVDEEYARELQGSRVIDAYFGYVEFIDLLRREQEAEARKRGHSHELPAFRSKFFLELQKTAIAWHQKRHQELRELETVIEDADRRAKAVLDGVQNRGVSGKAKA